jgi:nucleoside-diphosphate-sugar epimerase
MKRLLIVGCGDVALRAIPLLKQGYRVYALVRNPAYFQRLRALDVIPIMGDLDDRTSLRRLAGLADSVLHLAPPPNHGVKDVRTRNLLSALSRRGGRGPSRFRRTVVRQDPVAAVPRRLVYVSTSGVYGDCRGAWVSETHPLNATSSRAKRRVDAETRIRDWARRNHVSASILRVPGIYAFDRLPLGRVKQGMPSIIDSEDSYTNHIHADDLANICIEALQRGAACRVYHASDDSHLKMGQYFDCVADAFRLPRVPRVSRAEAQQVLPDSLLSFMNESRRLTNTRLKKELKVKLRYPSVAAMLAHGNMT